MLGAKLFKRYSLGYYLRNACLRTVSVVVVVVVVVVVFLVVVVGGGLV